LPGNVFYTGPYRVILFNKYNVPEKLHKTKGIVLRAVKYGETSLIVTMFTELFGVQSYIVNGVRVSVRKGSGRANLFQPSAILDLIVYHNELKHLNRIKEFKWGYLYQHIFSDVIKNSVGLFMVELLTKCLKQPEPNPDLFQFVEDSFIQLDQSSEGVMANLPLFFALHMANFFGVSPVPAKFHRQEEGNIYFDLKEASFSNQQPEHPHYIEGKLALVTAELLKVRHPSELEEIKLNSELRRELLKAYEIYYALHIQDFGTMKTLPVLREILS
jgi:DNA repair protein RecO (recombination protein O)